MNAISRSLSEAEAGDPTASLKILEELKFVVLDEGGCAAITVQGIAALAAL